MTKVSSFSGVIVFLFLAIFTAYLLNQISVSIPFGSSTGLNPIIVKQGMESLCLTLFDGPLEIRANQLDVLKASRLFGSHLGRNSENLLKLSGAQVPDHAEKILYRVVAGAGSQGVCFTDFRISPEESMSVSAGSHVHISQEDPACGITLRFDFPVDATFVGRRRNPRALECLREIRLDEVAYREKDPSTFDFKIPASEKVELFFGSEGGGGQGCASLAFHDYHIQSLQVVASNGESSSARLDVATNSANGWFSVSDFRVLSRGLEMTVRGEGRVRRYGKLGSKSLLDALIEENYLLVGGYILLFVVAGQALTALVRDKRGSPGGLSGLLGRDRERVLWASGSSIREKVASFFRMLFADWKNASPDTRVHVYLSLVVGVIVTAWTLYVFFTPSSP